MIDLMSRAGIRLNLHKDKRASHSAGKRRLLCLGVGKFSYVTARLTPITRKGAAWRYFGIHKSNWNLSWQ